jgi:hypothetical protein
MAIYDISKRTYNRLVEQKDPEIVARKYGIEVKREKISQEQKIEITRILDDILPIQSGRNYRYKETTDKQLYNTYCNKVVNGDPVSKSFFVYSIVAKERKRHSKARKFCLLCKQLESRNMDQNLVKHKELVGIQRLEYKKQKENIGNRIIPTVALIIQDFTQIQLENSFVQNLIICIYKKNNEKNGLNRTYKHFIGKLENKNDISFVVGAWKILLEENTFQSITIVNIWSDGGPKHFKISSNINFLQYFNIIIQKLIGVITSFQLIIDIVFVMLQLLMQRKR